MSARLGRLVAVACVLAAGCAPQDCNRPTSSSARTSGTVAAPEPTAGKVVSKELIRAIIEYDYFTREQFVLQGFDVPALVAAFAELPTEERLKMVEFVAGYRADPVQRADAVAALVKLCRDPDHEVYAAAASIVAQRAPDDLIRAHAVELNRVIEAHPEDDSSGWLAAKLGSARARQWVIEGKVAPRMDPVERDLVLGRIGDRVAEQRSLERYHAAMGAKSEWSQWNPWPRNMARMGTPAALLALAHDLRHPGVYFWLHDSERMVRADVVVGLAVAFPHEPVLDAVPTSDEDYARIEKWAEQKFGFTWPQPRPPYVHEAPAPTFP